MAGYVFISYSHEEADKKYVEHLAATLAQHGVAVQYDRDFKSGDIWRHKIYDMITRSDAVVVVMSPAAADSAWVEEEIQAAQSAGKRILPILFAGEKPFPALAKIQYEKASTSGALSDDFIDVAQLLVSPRGPSSPALGDLARATLRKHEVEGDEDRAIQLIDTPMCVRPLSLDPHVTSIPIESSLSRLPEFFDGELRRRCFVIGDAGSGKSTALASLGATLAKDALNDLSHDQDARAPITASFTSWAEGDDVLTWLTTAVGNWKGRQSKQFQSHVQAGRVVLLLDGLDEVYPVSRRKERLSDLLSFLDQHPTDVAITCRTEEFHHLPGDLKDRLGCVEIAVPVWRTIEQAIRREEGLGALADMAAEREELREALRILFVLNAAARVWRQSGGLSQPTIQTPQAWQTQILTAYVDAVVRGRKPGKVIDKDASKAARLVVSGLAWYARNVFGEYAQAMSVVPPWFTRAPKAPRSAGYVLAEVLKSFVVASVVTAIGLLFTAPIVALAVGGLVAIGFASLGIVALYSRDLYLASDADEAFEIVRFDLAELRHNVDGVRDAIVTSLRYSGMLLALGLVAFTFLALTKSPYRMDMLQWSATAAGALFALMLLTGLMGAGTVTEPGDPMPDVDPRASDVATALRQSFRMSWRVTASLVLVAGPLVLIFYITLIVMQSFLVDLAGQSVGGFRGAVYRGMDALVTSFSEAPVGRILPSAVWVLVAVAGLVVAAFCVRVLYFLGAYLTASRLDRWIRTAAGLPCGTLPFLAECERLGLVRRQTGSYKFRHRLLQDHFRELGV